MQENAGIPRQAVGKEGNSMMQFLTTKELEHYIKENYIDHLLVYMGEVEDRYGKGFIYYREESTNDYEGTFIYSDAKGYHYVYMEKNSVQAHQVMQDVFDISYLVLECYVYYYASDYAVCNYEEGKDYRRPLFENERKLWKLLDERGYERKCKEIAEILKKYPYVDTVETEMECNSIPEI